MHKTDMDLRSVVLTYSNAGISLSELEIDNMISTLRRLILRSRQINSPSYEDLKLLLSWTTSQLETVLNVTELDEQGTFDHGGLNDLYCEIMEYFSYPVIKGEFAYESDFVYWTK